MQLDRNTLYEIIYNVQDEIWVYDNHFNLICVNKTTEERHGLVGGEMVGESAFQLEKIKAWTASILSHVYASKEMYAVKCQSPQDVEQTIIAKPILDDSGNIKVVLLSVREDITQLPQMKSGGLQARREDIREGDIVWQCRGMQTVLKLAQKSSKLNATCLIVGEMGTGKTLLANYIHYTGNRQSAPFFALNCAAVPVERMDEELFGCMKSDVEEGGKTGLLERVNGGTLLLDEVSLLPLHVQSKLLQVLQEKAFSPLGSREKKSVDVKIIATTNQDLPALAKEGLFREDLYYRLNIFEIAIPPLNGREGDIDLLITHFLQYFSEKYQLNRCISQETLRILKQYSWPGNVQELRHTIERLVVTADRETIDPSVLPPRFLKAPGSTGRRLTLQEGFSFDEAVEAYKRELIQSAFETYKTTRKIGEALDISQAKASTLVRKYKIGS